jgi:hypothetical protein
VIQNAGDRWEQVIKRDLPAGILSSAFGPGLSGREVDDLLIDVSVNAITSSGQTSGIQVRPGSRLPIYAKVSFNDSTDDAYKDLRLSTLTKSQFPNDPSNKGNRLFKIALHEIGHALGIGTLWQRFINGSLYQKANSFAVAAYQTAVGNPNATGIPIDPRSGHWNPSWADERQNPFNHTEIMNPIIPLYQEDVVTGQARLSRISIGVLADLGYDVNFNAADPFGRMY